MASRFGRARNPDPTGRRGRSLAQALRDVGVLPTPTVKGNHNKRGLSARSGDGLATCVKEAGGQSGPLAPSFLEWMMGWPIGYSLPIEDIEPTESE